MKNIMMILTVFLVALALIWAPVTFAQEETGRTPNVEDVQEDVQEEVQEEIKEEEKKIDEIATSEEGKKKIEQNIKDEFEVDDDLIQNLREKKLGYGEINTTLALAQRMEGGINDDNIQRIVDMRTGESKTGWGKIASQFDVKVGDLKKSVNQSQHRGDHPAGQGKLNKSSSHSATKNLPNAPKAPKGK